MSRKQREATLRRTVVVVAASLGFAVGGAVGSALASPFGSISGGPWVANNGHHHVDFRNVDTQRYQMTIWTIDNTYEPLDPNIHVVDDTNYDVRVLDGDFGNNGLIAWVDCPSGATMGGSHPDRWCFGLLLRYNLDASVYPENYDTVAERHSLACEEFGHSFGLRHWQDHPESCLGRPVENSTVLTAHEKDHVNDYYVPSDGPA